MKTNCFSLKSLFASLMLIAIACGITTVSAETLVVGAKSNIFGAGKTTPPAPGGGGGGMLPPVISFTAGTGQVITFSSIVGSVSCCGPSNTFNGPDGGSFGVPTDIVSYGGISGIRYGPNKQMFLVGVFLDDSTPTDPAPSRLDFTGADNFDFLSPQLNQVFFIGDGLTGTGVGSVQRFNVPPEATRLFLGFADAISFHGLPGYYDDNAGQLNVTFEIYSGIDHFLSYKTKPSKGAAPVRPFSASLIDQFEEGVFEITKSVSLANPADNNGEGIIDPNTHLQGYQITGGPKHVPRQVEVNNELGELRITTIKANRLLVPTAESVTGPVDPPDPDSHNVDYFKCYDVGITKGTPKFSGDFRQP